MEGKDFTRFGLLLFVIAIILLITWSVLYDREVDLIIDGKVAPQGDSSKALLTAGVIITSFAYVSCIAGYAIATDFLNFSLKMPKNNLIEI